MSSLQALLDAQEERREEGGRWPTGAGGGRGGNNTRNRPSSSSISISHSRNAAHTISSTARLRRDGDGEEVGRGVGNNYDNHRSQRGVYNGRAYDDARNRNGSFNNNFGSMKREATAATSTTTKDSGGETAVSYEQRRANIEQRAIDDSRNAIMRGKRHALQPHRRRGLDDDDNTSSHKGCGDEIKEDFEEEDIQSLSSWVGPLIAANSKIINKECEEEDTTASSTKKKTMTCTYYQDREKRYPFYTDERGYQLLHRLLEANYELLRKNHRLIGESALAYQQLQSTSITTVHHLGRVEEANDEAKSAEVDNLDVKDIIIRIGKGLYAHKPTLRTKGVTWSTEEYSHPGLARMYLRMKSIQRFTEIWCLLERSEALGVFNEIFHGNKIKSTTTMASVPVPGEEQAEGGGNDDDNDRPVIRIAAVGGGPGYELLATKLFFEDRMSTTNHSGVKIELTCMDICPAWRHYAEALGFTFVEYDINNEDGINPRQAMGLARGELHFCIVSCVMIYVTNDRVMNMFHNLVHNDGVKAILVSERGERTLACTMMEELGGKVIRLIDQSDGMDERQAIWCSREFADEQLRTCHPDYEAHQSASVFPNVPYCEHKERRRRRPQSERSSYGSREYQR